jgi:hypothetical protein
VNAQWGVPLGLGLAVVHASLAVDVREASRRAARDLRQLRSALQTAQSRSTEMERQVALADAAARAEAGKGWAALQAKLTSTDQARAAASRLLAEQASALDTAERARARAEAAIARADSAAASNEKRARAAADKLNDSERRHTAALRGMEEQLRAKEAALAAAEADRTQLVAALRDAVHAAKRASRAEAAGTAKGSDAAKVMAAAPAPAAPQPAPAAALLVPIPEADTLPEVIVHNVKAASSARKPTAEAAPAPAPGAVKERTTNWPGPPPRPVWSASPSTMPLARYEAKPAGPAPPGASRQHRRCTCFAAVRSFSHSRSLCSACAAAIPARTPPRAEALVAVAEAAPTASASTGCSSGLGSTGSSQMDSGVVLICRTPGSARKRLDMSAAVASAGPARAEMASVTRPVARPAAEKTREEERRARHAEPAARGERTHGGHRSDAAAPAPAPAAAAPAERPRYERSDRHERRGAVKASTRDREREREREHAGRDGAAPSAQAQALASAAAPAPAQQQPAKAPSQHAHSKPTLKAAAVAVTPHSLADECMLGPLPPPPRAPLGRRSVNDMFLGLWEPSLGGATPSVPRRAAIQAQPRLAGWVLAGEGEFDE